MNFCYFIRRCVLGCSCILFLYLISQSLLRCASRGGRVRDSVVGAEVNRSGWSLGDETTRLLALVDEKDQPGVERRRYCAAVGGRRVCGAAFSADWTPVLESLGLSDAQTAQTSVRQDRERMGLEELQFVSAFSSNHFGDAKNGLLRQLAAHFPGRSLIVVDLGLSKDQVAELTANKDLKISIRGFDFDKYPKYVRQLTQYRWKPLLLAELLKEMGAVFYMDAHIEWTTGNLQPIRERMSCNKQIPNHCNQYPLMLLWPTGHSIFATTNEGIYKYLPIDLDGAQSLEMGCAGYQYTYGTSDTLRNIYKWAVLCALEKDCMGPPGVSGINCRLKPGKGSYHKFANCHRYDQSAFNILLANRHAFNRSAYYFQFNVPQKNVAKPGEYRPPPFAPKPLALE